MADGWVDGFKISVNISQQLFNSVTDLFYSARFALSQNIVQSSRHHTLQYSPNLGHIETVANDALHALIAQHCGQINISFLKLLAY